MGNTYKKRLQLPVTKSLGLIADRLTLRLLSKDWKNSNEIVAQGLKGNFNRRGKKEEMINQNLLQSQGKWEQQPMQR